MGRISIGLFLAITAAVVPGCYNSHGHGGGPPLMQDAAPSHHDGGAIRRPDGGTLVGDLDASHLPDAGPPPPQPLPTRKVDLLFLVDNSNSMAPKQTLLADKLSPLVDILTTGDFNQNGTTTDPVDFPPATDLDIGIVTSDMGAGPLSFNVPTCEGGFVPGFGDDGLLHTRGDTSRSGCMATYPHFLNFQAAASGADASAFAAAVSCVMTGVGTGGCGFEQPLEATLKAVSPSAPTSWTRAGYTPPSFFMNTFGHGDRENAGFVRDGSLLALVVLTDEDDCAAQDVDLYNPNSTRYTGDLNLRCAFDQDALYPVSRYADGFLQLRKNPSWLFFGAIVGMPVDLAPGENNWDQVDATSSSLDPRMREVADPSRPGALTPCCHNAADPSITAVPGQRIIEVAHQLERGGAVVDVESICETSFETPLQQMVAGMARILRR